MKAVSLANGLKMLRKSTQLAFNAVNIAWYARNGYRRLFDLLGGGGTHTGQPLTVERALQCSVVNVATRMITDSLSSMPLTLHRKTFDGQTEVASDLPLYDVLKMRPNTYQTSKVFRRTLTHHALNYGNGYARIVRRGEDRNQPVIGLHLIHPSRVRVVEQSDGSRKYLISSSREPVKTLDGEDVFHLQNMSDDGVTGMGAVEAGRQAIAQCLALEEYGARFFARGGMGSGMLQTSTPFDDEESRKQFREDLRKTYEGLENAHKTIITEGDWKFTPFTTDANKAQLIETRMFMVPEVCRYYGLSPHLAGDLSKATFSNVEHLGQEFLSYTLLNWTISWEEEIVRCLLTPKERAAGVYAKHNTNAFLRGDFEKRWKGYATALQNGVKSINEVRELEDLDPIEGGDAHHIQLNMQTVPGTGEETTAQQAQLIKISAGQRRRRGGK
jgi:HK97 family phage portal protein